VLVVCISEGMGEIVSVCTGVAKSGPDGMAWVNGSLLVALEE